MSVRRQPSALRPLGGLARGLGLVLVALLHTGLSFAQSVPTSPPPPPVVESPRGPSAPERDAPAAQAPTPPAGAAPGNPDAPAKAAPDTWGLPRAAGAPPAPARTPATPPELPSPCPCADGTAETDLSSVRYTLEGVSVRGNTRTSTRVVMRFVPFRTGDVIDVRDSAFTLARYRLLGTGFFREVEFSLAKGSKPGRVVLVIEVAERNTIVLNDVAMGLSADAETQGPTKGRARPITAYAGIDVAETNLAGTGITLGGAAVIAKDQLALRARFLDPAFLGSSFMVAGTLLYNNAHDFFGNADVRWAHRNGDTEHTDFAVVGYRRFGGSLGVGRDISLATQIWAQYRLETIDANYPNEASHRRGFDIEPIDFDVIRGRSVLSTVRTTLQHDTRDHPFLPTRGWLVTLAAELSLLPAALDYDFQKAELHFSRWWRLPWHSHVLELDIYGGAIAGNAPFFEQFYVGDLTDFLPDRVLGMNFDRRPPPNFLGTQIVEERYGSYALKISGEYRIPLYRGQRSIYGIDFFASAGIYGIAGNRTITDHPSGYSDLARLPLDLTGNLGFRADTSAGGFVFAFANALGFIPLRGQGPAGE